MARSSLNSEFLAYLASNIGSDKDVIRLPSLNYLSKKLGVSVSSLREQMEVARALGFVEARPRTGMHRQPYSFTPAILQSLRYAIALNQDYFTTFSDLRVHVEIAYWHEAVRMLTTEDKDALKALINCAWDKLKGTPIQIPQSEHRELHLLIYRRIKNPFVIGILEAYWEAYEAVGLNLYADYDYLKTVWQYHECMVQSICTGDFDKGYDALIEHTDLIYHRSTDEQEVVKVT
jgi:DNA-binding FadR family transcriptional regulator